LALFTLLLALSVHSHNAHPHLLTFSVLIFTWLFLLLTLLLALSAHLLPVVLNPFYFLLFPWLLNSFPPIVT
jgi:hypothetical protein